jgi:flagellar motor switch protein FliN/FliY
MATELRTILQLKVPVIVQIGQRNMALDDVLALGPGAILELHKSFEDELELYVNNKCIGRGNAVKVGENFGLRIACIGTQKERIQALAT